MTYCALIVRKKWTMSIDGRLRVLYCTKWSRGKRLFLLQEGSFGHPPPPQILSYTGWAKGNAAPLFLSYLASNQKNVIKYTPSKIKNYEYVILWTIFDLGPWILENCIFVQLILWPFKYLKIKIGAKRSITNSSGATFCAESKSGILFLFELMCGLWAQK